MVRSVLQAAVGAGVLAACVGLGSPAQAITINDGYGDANSIALGSPFTAVVDILTSGSQFCTGTLISATAVLTAQHCVHSHAAGDFTVVVKSAAGATLDTIGVSSIHEVDGTTANDGTDIAIITLSSAIPGADATPMRLLDAAAAAVLGDAITAVGFGNHGTGTTGSTGLANNDNTRRAMTNVVDSVTGNILRTDFDDGTAGKSSLGSATPTTAEGSTAGGDSGGPLLWYDPVLDEYLIAGVLYGGSNFLGPDSGYGDISVWHGIDAFQTFIEGLGGEFVAAGVASVPEPETLALFVLALAGMAFYRRRSFNR